MDLSALEMALEMPDSTRLDVRLKVSKSAGEGWSLGTRSGWGYSLEACDAAVGSGGSRPSPVCKDPP